MKNIRKGDLIERVNERTGYIDREAFKAIDDFKSVRKYSDFMVDMFAKREKLFMDYFMATKYFIESPDCPLSDLNKARNLSVMDTLLSMFHNHNNEIKRIQKDEEQEEHEKYQESLFKYLNSYRKNQSGK